MIEITEKDFSLEEMVRMAKSNDAGAIVTFLGTVRDDGITSMELEAYSDVARRELENIAHEAQSRFHLKSVNIVHRVGRLDVGDDIVAIVVSAAHRDEAFMGCRHIIEELKARALIWKKEIGSCGERWVGHE